jgi:hypothetical protein
MKVEPMLPLAHTFTKGIILVLVILVFALPTVAQQTDTCDPFIDHMALNLSTNCANTELGQACYGYANGAVLLDDMDEELVNFSQPVDLSEMLYAQTSPYDRAANEWGVIYIRGYANLATALALENSFLYFIVGDTLVTTEVPEDEALLLLDEPVRVETSTAVDLLSFPPSFDDRVSQVVRRAPAGTELLADGISVDGWVRVAAIYTDTRVGRRSTA